MFARVCIYYCICILIKVHYKSSSNFRVIFYMKNNSIEVNEKYLILPYKVYFVMYVMSFSVSVYFDVRYSYGWAESRKIVIKFLRTGVSECLPWKLGLVGDI